MKYPKSLQTLITALQKLPGVGAKTAERYSFDILNWNSDDTTYLSNQLANIKTTISSCKTCNALLDLTQKNPCEYCDENKRNPKQLCILSSQKDLFAVESTHTFLGMYHVLSGLLCPLNNFSTKDLDMQAIIGRIESSGIEEIILALDSTIEGDATSLYLKKELSILNVKISRLALGIPIGSSLDFIDEGTLSKALSERTLF